MERERDGARARSPKMKVCEVKDELLFSLCSVLFIILSLLLFSRSVKKAPVVIYLTMGVC